MVCHQIKLSLQTLMVKLKNGLKLISVSELPHTTQTKTKLFFLTERSIPTSLSFLLQDLITLIITLMVFQRWDKVLKRKMFMFTWWIIKKPLLETTTMDGTIKVETCFSTLQKLHIRVKETTFGLYTTNLGWDKIKFKEDMLLVQRSNTGLQTKKFSNLDMLMKLLLMNATREVLKLCLDGNFKKFTLVRWEKKWQLLEMLTQEKSVSLDLDTVTSTHQVSHGKTLLMLELLMLMAWLMSTHTLFNMKDSKTFSHSVMLLEETLLDHRPPHKLSAQLLKTMFLDSWKEKK